MGIDPGIATTGFGVVNKTKDKTKVVAYGVIRTDKDTSFELRIQEIYKDLSALIDKYKPAVCGVEKLFYTTNQKTVMTVSQCRGVICLALAQKNVIMEELTPLQVKNYLTGYGKADKKAVQKMITSSLGLKEVPKPDDAADALAIAYCTSLIFRD